MNIRKRSKDVKLNTIICKRVTELRKLYKLTQEQLAYQSGISKGGLSEIEHCKKEPSTKTIMLICFGLGITPKDFYNFSDIEKYIEELNNK